MVDTKPLLKGLGAGANVFAQIATDKAVNARRRTSSTFDLTDGQIISDIDVSVAMDVPHSLNRVPAGIVVLKSSPASQVSCTATTLKTVQIVATPPAIVTVWVV